jgi:lipoprotein-releasing system permease protein
MFIFAFKIKIVGIVRFIGGRFSKIEKGGFSSSVIRISTYSVALSVAVMLISVMIVKGFQLEIRNKVVGFAGHIIVKPYQISAVEQQEAIQFDRADLLSLKDQLPQILNVQPTAEKSGIIKTDDQMEACIFKGVNQSFYQEFIISSIVEGSFPQFGNDTVNNEIVISKTTADRLNFKLGDFLRMYFLLPGESQPRGRRFIISGIYNSGLTEFDKKYMFGDIGHVQQLNQWDDNQAGLIEVFINDFDKLDFVAKRMTQILDYDVEVWTVQELYPEIFNWLILLDMNVQVITIIMLIVALINVVTILLIRILEKTSAIGILKSLGISNSGIRRIFLLSLSKF